MDNPIWLALASEAGIAADQIGQGATLLDSMNVTDGYTFARVAFPLSIGIERACKLLLQVDARLEHGAYLTDVQLRRLGHNLTDLVTAVDSVNARRGVDVTLPSEPVHNAILAVLTGFATGGRYHGLNFLAGARVTADAPSKQWWDTVVTPVLGLHYANAKREADEAVSERIGAELDTFSLTRHSHLDGGSMTSMIDAMRATSELKAATPWVRMYVLHYARWICNTARELTYASYDQAAAEIPHLTEFFAHFGNNDRFLRSRKTWRLESR